MIPRFTIGAPHGDEWVKHTFRYVITPFFVSLQNFGGIPLVGKLYFRHKARTCCIVSM
jgi:hypothetical protein